jgi:Fe-S-cluster-containing hydrogenase component 2
MTRRLLVTPSRCTGCRSCEIACAFSHPGRGGKPGRSAIRTFLRVTTDARTISRSSARAAERTPDVGTPVVCLQCDTAACVEVCPTRALVRDEVTGAIIVRDSRCVRCRTCVSACPFGNVAFDTGSDKVVKCDLCNGEPRCAQFCPTRTLQYI